MPRIPDHTRCRILQLHRDGQTAPAIRRVLADTGNVHSVNGIKGVISRFFSTGSLADAPRGQPSILDEEDLDLIHERMLMDDETTAPDLHKILLVETGKDVSLPTIRRARRKLGWIATGAKYCQLIRFVNREKRLIYAINCLHTNEQFDDVIFSDESSVQLDQHATVCFRHVNPETGEAAPRKLKPRPKHPTTVHVWAAISRRGATMLKVFDGIMDQTFYQGILKEALVPFIQTTYPEGHRFFQDNDPKHTSRQTQDFMVEHGIRWWPTPPESPDLNPIEHVWHEMKHFLRKTHKPRTKGELVSGLQKFWLERMTPEKCCRYIDNLSKAIPKVIEVNGHATGF